MLCLQAFRWMAAILFLGVSSEAHAVSLTCASLKPYMESSHIPDVAVAIFARGGVKNLFCTSSPLALSPNAVFEAASLSKPVFALGVLTLVREGKLDLDRPLAEYLGDAYTHEQNAFGQGKTDVVLNPQFAKITARMVLSHTAGLPNWSHHGPLTMQSEPGVNWSYSGEGFVYLQTVVRTITHQPIDAFLQERVLVPLGMFHSSFVWHPDLQTVALPGHSATGATQPIEQYAKPVVSSTSAITQKRP